MESPVHRAKIKNYLARKIVKEKDFVIEKGAIRLENADRTAHLNRHYNNGQWYYAETDINGTEPNFRPVREPVIEQLRNHYADSGNLQTALDAIEEQKSGKRKIENTLNMCTMKTKTITRTGLYDHWQREIVRDGSGTHYVLVDDVPHHTTKAGEPTLPLCNFIFQEFIKPPSFDSNDYPDGFDPTLYGLENGKVLNTKKQKGLTL